MRRAVSTKSRYPSWSTSVTDGQTRRTDGIAIAIAASNTLDERQKLQKCSVQVTDSFCSIQRCRQLQQTSTIQFLYKAYILELTLAFKVERQGHMSIKSISFLRSLYDTFLSSYVNFLPVICELTRNSSSSSSSNSSSSSR